MYQKGKTFRRPAGILIFFLSLSSDVLFIMPLSADPFWLKLILKYVHMHCNYSSNQDTAHSQNGIINP
ncbi:hypothetical protein BofuT4_uP089220.1 [Botrytis cinerea T4]|uniref:Uncharacterized protein n=1 Tax=Botryotinia fuckeliana (strain T4) TaxID=999810 RepID=G2YFH5_BOTF4|nr:hypothetical protein BofuT4_uP089220.1 [Botrytis cinerea T4]